MERQRRATLILHEQRVEVELAALEWTYDELVRVRLWLDAMVSSAKEYSTLRPHLRRTPEPEAPPDTIRIYADAEAFVSEDERRGHVIDERLIVGGADFGTRWMYVDHDHPWVNTFWRVSYIEHLGEIYAEMQHPWNEVEYSWDGTDRQRRAAPLWLLRSGVPAEWSARTEFYGPSRMYELLTEYRREFAATPNSLLALAERLARLSFGGD